MTRWVVVLGLVLACANHKDDAPAPPPESEFERDARKIRESYRVVLAEFHADVVAGNLDGAYERLAPMYRASVSREQFAAVAKHPFFTSGVTFTMRGARTSNGLSTAEAWMDGPLGKAAVKLSCTAVDNTWKISGLTVDGQPVLPSPDLK
jgi:hypothetical protein